MFIESRLPYSFAIGFSDFINPFFCYCLERPNYRWDRIGGRSAELFKCRDTVLRVPTGVQNYDYSMHMIRHYNVFIYYNIWTYFCRFYPFVFNNYPIFTQLYLAVCHISKNTFLVVRTYRYKICTRPGIILFLQSD